MNYWMLGGALVLGWLLISRKMTPEEVRRSKRIKFTNGLISLTVVIGLLWWMSFVFRMVPL